MFVDLKKIRDQIRNYAMSVCEQNGLEADVHVDVLGSSGRRELAVEVHDLRDVSDAVEQFVAARGVPFADN